MNHVPNELLRDLMMPPLYIPRHDLSLQELEFLAEDCLVDVMPLTRMKPINLLRDTYGPFRPHTRISIPLWLAVQMYRAKHCRILLPDWMDHSKTTKNNIFSHFFHKNAWPRSLQRKRKTWKTCNQCLHIT